MKEKTEGTISIAEELAMAKKRNQELKEELELARVTNDNRRMENEIKRLNKEYTPFELTATYGYGGVIPCDHRANFNPY